MNSEKSVTKIEDWNWVARIHESRRDPIVVEQHTKCALLRTRPNSETKEWGVGRAQKDRAFDYELNGARWGLDEKEARELFERIKASDGQH
jgi:hypothetical protein